MSRSGRSIARTSLALLPWQSVIRAAEAALPLAIAAWFGRSQLTDVYYFAWAVFALAGSVVFSAFHDSAVIPILTEVKARDPGALPAVRGSLFAHALALATLAATIVGAVAAAWFCARYDGRARTLALWMILPLSLYLVALTIKTFFASMLNAVHRYAAASFASAAGAGLTLAVMACLRGTLSVAAVPCGSLAGEIAAATYLAWSVRTAGIAIRPTFARPEPVRRIARLIASEATGGAVTRLNPVVDQLMAAFTGVAGGGTILKLSSDVASVPTSLLQSALLPVLLTHLSEDFAARNPGRARTTVRRALLSVLCVLGLAAVAIELGRRPLVALLFAHGAMDTAGVDRLSSVLSYQLLGVAPFGALLMLARAHVAAQNSRIMLAMGLLNAATNAVLDVVLVVPLGLEGLALSTSLTYVLVASVFFLLLEPRLEVGPAPRRLSPEKSP